LVFVYLYGKFRKKVPGYTVDGDCVLPLEAGNEETIASVLKRLDISQDEVSHLFLNHQYSGLSRKVRDGDRLAIFPLEMKLIYRQYFARVEDNETEGEEQ